MIPGFARDPDANDGARDPAEADHAQDRNVFHPAAVAPDQSSTRDLGLVEEFTFVAKYARDPDRVKVTMTGPHALARSPGTSTTATWPG